VSDDVSLARSAGAVTDMLDAWRRTFPLWEAYFAVVALGTTVFVLLDGDRDAAVIPLAAMAVWYVLLGRRVIRDNRADWLGWLYLVGAALLLIPAVVLNGGSAFILFALAPQAYMTLPFGPATAVTIVTNGIPSAVTLVETRDIAFTLAHPVPIWVAATVLNGFVAASIIRTLRRSDAQEALIAELESTRAEVARLSHAAGVAAERQRLAGDIHDTVAQGLSSVVMLVQAVEAELDRAPDTARRHLELAGRTARENLAEVRALVAALTPDALTHSSCVDAVRRLAGRFADETGAETSFEVTGAPAALPTAVDVVLLRAAQEALANTRKHAGARSVQVRLEFCPTTVALEVHDDGCGFAPTTVPRGYGLSGMRLRVEQVGGTASIHSGPGEGTAVRVEVPVP